MRTRHLDIKIILCVLCCTFVTVQSGSLDLQGRWALQPIPKVKPPSCKGAEWIKTPIDAFILHTLEERGMHPSGRADKRVLLRRVYYDLIGLPPTPAELNAFVTDESSGAYERVIDQLLERPEYGERWARHWLDVVHYAETHGHDQDRPRTNSWPYRDYVIASFNSDKPYARFVQEQIAGDILFPDDPQGVVAMGFLATGPWDESSLRDIRDDSIDRQIARYIDRDDVVSTVMNTFVSTTVQCARCHDHKFDPITQKEYYSLQAVFAQTDKANRLYDPDPEVYRKRRKLLARKRDIQSYSAAARAELLSASFQQRVAQWEQSLTSAPVSWQILKPLSCTSSNGATLSIQPDSSVISAGKRPETDTYVITTSAEDSTGIRLEVMADDSLPHRGPGRQDNGNLHLTDFRVFARHEDGSRKELTLVNPSADFDQQDWEITKAIDNDPKTAWGIYPAVGKSHQAVFELTSPVDHTKTTQLEFVLAQDHGGGHLIGRVRLARTTAPPPIHPSSLSDEISAILAIARAERSEEQRLSLAVFVALAYLDRELNELPEQHIVYAGASDFVPDASFKPVAKPRVVELLKRGDIHQPLEVAKPGTLHFIQDLPADFALDADSAEGPRRVALAKWIVDSRNSLTWRSIVNRAWHYHFGRGLVSTPNDFGKMGSTPSHPELLDWLATWFRDNGGSFKVLHKLILMSATYQQSAAGNPNYAEIDADNTLLWRMNRERLDAESVRDAILTVSGTMDRRMGGPSAQQFLMSAGIHVTPKVDYNGFDVDRLEARRRSVYRFVFRTLPDPFMDSLDCPDSSQLTPVRNTSVTVAQALAMMNDHFIVRYSEHFAERLETERPGDLAEQIRLAIELAFSREPRPGEVAQFRSFGAKHGMPNLCRVMLNSNEFMFID